ncbi:uncharacterized protein [Musca autumnalis]|uniref:uncharacterized protein n=1 Tax=Musca autumnalis TaxID=221902 RepID=UPI003CF01AA7
MFSFFTKKAQNPDSPVIIQGPQPSTNDSQNNGADDFIFVEKKGGDRPEQPTPPPPAQHPMYPQIPPGMGGYGGSPYPRYPYGPAPPAHAGSNSVTQNHPVPYVQDIPFVLAPQLCTKTTFDDTQTQVDGILAFLTRQMSVNEEDEYNFTLERSIQNECY